MFEIKYKISTIEKGKAKRSTRCMAVENALDIHDAIVAAMARLSEAALAARTREARLDGDGATMTVDAGEGPDPEIVSARRVNIKETFPAEGGRWYEVTVKENPVADERPMRYMMLFAADSLDDCMARAKAALEQGYDMTTVAVRESPVDWVIDASASRAETTPGA